MTDGPATPPPPAPQRFTYHQLWTRCEMEMSRNAAWVGLAQSEGRAPTRSHTEGEAMFRQLCGLLDLIIRDDDLRARIRDAARRASDARNKEGENHES